MSKRNVIHIDEEKCDGCGLCAAACAEGAIAIVDGKARLVSEIYCDGLGACIGECPQGAITIEEREAADFDPEAVEQARAETARLAAAHPRAPEPLPCGCPGSAVRDLARQMPAAGPEPLSQLANWPVQLRLVPVFAPYLDDADLVIAADCAPFAHANFHQRFLAGRVLLVGCPKLDDAAAYREKLAEIFRQHPIRSVEVPYMEVPCCGGLVRLVLDAATAAGANFPVTLTRIGVHGEIQESRVAHPGRPACPGAPQA